MEQVTLCAHCETAQAHGRSKFCSAACRDAEKAKRRKPLIICDYCGLQFKARGTRPRRFCSYDCYAANYGRERHDPNATHRSCRECGTSYPVDHFPPTDSKAGSPYCRECYRDRVRAYARTDRQLRAKQRASRLRKRYGISPEQHEAMLQEQGGRCWICRGEGTLYVDHCHTTGIVRGLLCPGCNSYLSKVERDPEVLDRVRSYLAAERTNT